MPLSPTPAARASNSAFDYGLVFPITRDPGDDGDSGDLAALRAAHPTPLGLD